MVTNKLSSATRRRRTIWADGAYQGPLHQWVLDHLAAVVEIVHKDPTQRGFRVLPRRWVVRTFAWLGRYRYFSKDYEHSLLSGEAVVYIASLHIMLKRLDPAS